MSSDVPKGQPLVPRRSQAGGETPGWPERCSSPPRRRAATQDPREQKRPWSHGRQGRWFPKQQGSGQNLPGADHLWVPHPSKLHSSPLPVVWPWKLIQPVWIKEVQCASCSPPPWGIYSLAPSLGHLGQAVRSAESSGRSFLEILTSRFWWLPLTLVPLGQELATAQSSLGFSAPCPYLCKCSKSPTYERVYSERGFVSQVCSLSPANLA